MPTIIGCTNFSSTSRNALSYVCSLINNKATKEEISIVVLHIYTIPANYSGDGIALATINNALDEAELNLHDELDWLHEQFPDLNAIGKIGTGRLLPVLKEEVEEMRASLIVLGTGGNYGDLWSWDTNILNLLRDLPVPAITIPPRVTYKPLQNIGFACNLNKVNDKTPFSTLINLIRFTEAKLHVIYVTPSEIKPGSTAATNELIVSNQLKEISPVYHIIFETDVVRAIGDFVEENQIQLLLVIPKRHGLWKSLFHKSFTKELARLNRLPILALHE